MLRNATLTLLALAGAAHAHPGHDAAILEGQAHWLTSASHWVVVALTAIVAAELARRAVRTLAARAFRAMD